MTLIEQQTSTSS